MNDKLNEIKISCCLNKNKIEPLCPKIIKDELDMNSIKSLNYNELTKEILQDYCRMLVEHLASVSENSKK